DKQYRSWEPRQGFLLPPSPLDWLPEGHLAYFILELLDQLDVTQIERSIRSKDARGTRPYSPAMMTGLLLYAYCVGVYSSRKIERATYEDVAFRILAGGQHPYFTTINEFRKTHLEALSSLFVQVLQLCRRAGLVKLGHVAMDGLRRIRQAKAELEAEARASRAAELREQAEQARQRAAQESRSDKARKAEETRARRREEQAAALDEARVEDFVTQEGLPKHRVRTRPDGTPHPKAQRNFVDSDSRIMECGGSFLQGYNCQLAVDEEHQIIVAQAVTNQCPDNGNLVPLLDQVARYCGRSPTHATADAGYWYPQAEEDCCKRGTDGYVAPDRQRRGGDPPPSAPSAAEQPTERDRMREKLRTVQGRAIYARRKAVVEPVNGQIKEARGFRRFLLRGLNAVGGQWSLVCTGHNILKLYRAAQAAT
ncbi:MAG: transposase, partial [Thermoanaerobaculia bacterium]